MISQRSAYRSIELSLVHEDDSTIISRFGYKSFIKHGGYRSTERC